MRERARRARDDARDDLDVVRAGESAVARGLGVRALPGHFVDGALEGARAQQLRRDPAQALERLLERGSADPFQRQPRDAVLLPHLEHAHDAGVVQPGAGLDLAPEAAARRLEP